MNVLVVMLILCTSVNAQGFANALESLLAASKHYHSTADGEGETESEFELIEILLISGHVAHKRLNCPDDCSFI